MGGSSSLGVELEEFWIFLVFIIAAIIVVIIF